MKKITMAFTGLFLCLALTNCNNSNAGSEARADSSSVKPETAGVTDDWKIGIQMWTFKMFSFVDALDKVDSAGVKSIEAYWGQPLGGGMKDSFGINMSTESRAKIKELLNSKGISIVAMGVIV